MLLDPKVMVCNILQYSLGNHADISSGGVWDESMAGYSKIRDKASKLLLQNFNHAYPSLFKQYFQKAQWMTVGEEDDPAPSISPELDQPLRVCSILKHKT